MVASYEETRLHEQSDENSVDPPARELDTDDELFGERSDPPRRTTIASTSTNVTMEDVNRETISSSVSPDNVIQESTLIDLTNGDQNNDCEMAEYDTSASMTIAQVPIISKSVLKIFKGNVWTYKMPYNS